MKLNIIIKAKDSGKKVLYVAENNFSPFNLKFVVVQSGKSKRNLHMSKGNLKPKNYALP